MGSVSTEAAGAAREVCVGLLWHSINSGNLGVGALTISNLALVREAAARAGVTPRFKILGFVDQHHSIYVRDPDVEHLPLNTKAMLPGGSYWRALGDLDCVLDIGAGDSFADIYGLKRFGYMWLTKLMPVFRGVPLLLSPQTIGPFDRQPYTFLAADAMQRARAVVTRDPLSFDVARRMAPKTRVIQSVDVAFALPFQRRNRIDPTTTDVGINVSGLLFNGGYSGANEFGMQVNYADYTRQLIEAFEAVPGAKVHLVAHVNSDEVPQDDDRAVADRLAAEFPGAIRVPDFGSPSEAKSYISGLDFLVAGRMHACIAAFSSGVPVVPVAYSRKFAGLFDGVLGYKHIVPVKGLTTEEAVQFTLDRFARRSELAQEIDRGLKTVDGLLDNYRTELADLFRATARRVGS